MTNEQAETLKAISQGTIRCWVNIKAKARARGDITNIEKHAPCITSALNAMEDFLPTLEKENDRLSAKG